MQKKYQKNISFANFIAEIWRSLQSQIAKILIISAVFSVSACVTSKGRDGLPGLAGVSAVNFAEDSTIGDLLRRSDVEVLETIFVSAMADANNPSRVDWQGDDASGQVEAGNFFLANLLDDPDALMASRGGLDLSYSVEIEQGDFVLSKNSNIRNGPSTDYSILETLQSGTPVRGVGKVQGERWMLVADDKKVIGYIFEELIVKAPGTQTFDLAGRPIRNAVLCREFVQTLNVAGRKDRWGGLACDFGDGWELANQGGPVILGNGF